MTAEVLLQKTRKYSGKILDLEVWESQLADGLKASREIVLHVPAVAIIPVIAPGEYLLVQQFRPAADQSLWEIPAGSVDRYENPETAAKRELAEETGYDCHKLELLFSAFPSPGFLTEKISVYAAYDLFHAPQTPDADERIQVKAHQRSQVLDLIRNNTIQDFKTISAFLYFWNLAGKN